jgi:hypothetical protein
MREPSAGLPLPDLLITIAGFISGAARTGMVRGEQFLAKSPIAGE